MIVNGNPIAIASARAPGTCGEPAQGILEGSHFLVTCPIDLYSRVAVEIIHGDGRISARRNYYKARRAVEATLEHLGTTGFDVRLTVTHSGTVVGMLFEDDPPLVDRAVTLARETLAGLADVKNRSVVGGGIEPAVGDQTCDR